MPAAAQVARIASLRAQAEALCAALPPWMVKADRVANTVAHGAHGRRRVGLGEAFWQFRRYGPGDSTRAIDWRQSARNSHLFVRETEWEAAETLWCWCDLGPGMGYRSQFAGASKADRALLLCLSVAGLLMGAGERVGLLGAEGPPRAGQSGFGRFAEALADSLMTADAGTPPKSADASGSTPPSRPLARHSKLLLFGDFLAPLERIAALIRYYADQGVQGYLMQILDPAEEDFPFTGRVVFHDGSAADDIAFGRAQSVRLGYREKLDNHRAGLQTICQDAGWRLTLHRTDQTPQLALLGLYRCLADDMKVSV